MLKDAAFSSDNSSMPASPLNLLRSCAQPLYALLDAARDPRILELLEQSGEPHTSLYEGEQGEDLAAWAPYLVAFTPGAPLLKELVEEGWGLSWGVYFTSEADFGDLRNHFRHFLLVKLDDGRSVYFRFYDPRVLRCFLSTCSNAEARALFGPVLRYFVEDKEQDWLIDFLPPEGYG